MDKDVLELKEKLEKKFADVQDNLKKLQDEGASKEDLKEATEAIEEQGKILENFLNEQKLKVVQSIEEKFSNFLIEKHEDIQKIFKSGSGEVVFNPFEDIHDAVKEMNKAVGDITTGSGTDQDTVPVVMGTQLGSFNLRNDNDLLNLCTTTATNSAALSYTEMIPKEGSYDFVAEGAEKPQIDFKWENRYPRPKKAAAYEILTEEAVTDYARLDSVAREYLRKKHDLFKVNGVYFGDGTGDNPTGATVYGRTFVAGDMADFIPNGKSNVMDVINACVTDIYMTSNFTDEEHYQANTAMISPVDFFKQFVAAKDENGLPLYPQASLFGTVTIAGITIRPWVKIPAGKIFVADMSKYNVVNYVPFSIRIGWINDQFITNKFTMLGESRYFQYVKNLDQAAFIYDDIATVVGAIEAA